MQDPIQTVAMAAGLGWASGLKLYAVLFFLGLLGRFGVVTLPHDLTILGNPWVMGVSGFLFVTEFLADKVPAVDSLWDSIHTFIRIPAGALLAAATIGDGSPELRLVAALLGGTLAGTTHFTKAGTRAMINTSPEPFTNIAASLGEEALVASGLFAAFNYPVVFLAGLALFVLISLWLLPRLWRAVRKVFGGVAKVMRPGTDSEPLKPPA